MNRCRPLARGRSDVIAKVALNGRIHVLSNGATDILLHRGIDVARIQMRSHVVANATTQF